MDSITKKARLVNVNKVFVDFSAATASSPNKIPKADNNGKIDTSFLKMHEIIPPGTVVAYAGTTPPNGWLLCNGAAVSRTLYANLFAVIGTTHGIGDGSTTFNLPDYRGRFLRMVDGTAGRDPDKNSRIAMNPGGNTGNNVGSVQGFAIQSHSHRWLRGTEQDDSSYGGSYNEFTMVPGSFNEGFPIDYHGGNETRPVNAYVNFIIKT